MREKKIWNDSNFKIWSLFFGKNMEKAKKKKKKKAKKKSGIFRQKVLLQ